MVLATDMTKHFEHVSKFVNMLDKCSMTREETDCYEVSEGFSRGQICKEL